MGESEREEIRKSKRESQKMDEKKRRREETEEMRDIAGIDETQGKKGHIMGERQQTGEVGPTKKQKTKTDQKKK